MLSFIRILSVVIVLLSASLASAQTYFEILRDRFELSGDLVAPAREDFDLVDAVPTRRCIEVRGEGSPNAYRWVRMFRFVQVKDPGIPGLPKLVSHKVLFAETGTPNIGAIDQVTTTFSDLEVESVQKPYEGYTNTLRVRKSDDQLLLRREEVTVTPAQGSEPEKVKSVVHYGICAK
jgi:hypothetical protein